MNISKTFASMATAVCLVLSFTSCEKGDDTTKHPTSNNPLYNYVLAGEKNTTNADVKLYFAEEAFVGYNTVAVELFEPGTQNVIENAIVSFLPMMDMGTMKHSTPFTNPAFDVDMDAYMGSSTFIMPGGTMGSWTIAVIIDHNGNIDTATFDIDVVEKTEAKLISFVSAADSTTKLFVALKEPSAPEIGLNNFEVMIYKRETMMSFPAVTDLTIEIEPEMPTMGHGSPNNENPVHVAEGLYRGKVNFTMSGFWKVNMSISDNNGKTVRDDTYFDITFQ
tara:strand:+ start:225089 stop:225922 length:834 start_codon:yes stop_codon:yes gene_type:complete